MSVIVIQALSSQMGRVKTLTSVLQTPVALRENVSTLRPLITVSVTLGMSLMTRPVLT